MGLILQLLLRLLVLHIPEPLPGPEGEDIRAIRDQWLLASGIPFIGCVPHDLEEIVMTQSGLSLARSALTSLTLALKDMPERLPGQLFPLLGMGEPGSVDISTDHLLTVASDILGLLDTCGESGGQS